MAHFGGFVVFTTRRHYVVESCLVSSTVFLFVSVLFSIAITALGEQRAGLNAPRAFVLLTHICLMDFPRSAASDQGLHCLPMSQNWDTRLI